MRLITKSYVGLQVLVRRYQMDIFLPSQTPV